MTISEMFAESIEMRMKLPAYSIYWALQNNKIYDDDDADLLELVNFDMDQIKELITSDPLQIEVVKVYAVAYERGVHHMVFAHSPEQAVAYMSENMTPQSVKDVSSRMRVEFYDDSTKTNFTLQSMLQSVTTFPYYAFTLNNKKPHWRN